MVLVSGVTLGCASVVTRPSQVRATLSASPTPAEIIAAADAARIFLTETVDGAQTRANSLKKAIGTGEAVSKLGQYIGGGGAIFFGLNEKGKNAAYSAAVAAFATLVDQLLKNNQKSEDRAICLELANMRVELEKVLGAWRLQANDPGFQATFVAERNAFYDRVDERFRKCNSR